MHVLWCSERMDGSDVLHEVLIRYMVTLLLAGHTGRWSRVRGVLTVTSAPSSTSYRCRNRASIPTGPEVTWYVIHLPYVQV